MKFSRTATIAAILWLPALGFCQNIDIKDVPFRVAGGKTVILKITDRGAVPAENDKFKINAAAVIVRPSSKDKKIPVLVWSFGLISKTNKEISRITVENVFPSDPAVLLVEDNQPRLREGSWVGQMENGEPEGNSNGWLKTEKLSAFVFKFSVTYEGGEESTLYQLSAFGENDKQFFRQAAEQLRARHDK